MELLRAKLDGVLEESRKEAAKSMDTVTYQGKALSVKNEKLREWLLKANELEAEIPKAASTDDKSALYDQVFISLNEARSHLRDDMNEVLKKEGKADVQMANFTAIQNYLKFKVLGFTVDRNKLLVASLKDKLATPVEGEKPVRPDDVARLYETLTANMDELLELSDKTPTAVKLHEARSYSYRAWRCFYLAESYALALKAAEADALYEHVMSLHADALAAFQQCSDVDKAEDVKALGHLKTECFKRRCLARASFALSDSSISDSVKQLNLAKSAKTAASTPLVFRMDTYQTMPAGIQPTLVDFPPVVEPTPCKPLLLDLAFNSIDYPDVSARAKKKGASWGSWLMGRK